MSAQVVLPGAATIVEEVPTGVINLAPSFKIRAQDTRLAQKTSAAAANGHVVAAAAPPAPLGVLSNFTGTFAGKGFNTIFRPSPDSAGLGDNVLELNLTTETLSFSNTLGDVPNRGTGQQADIFLNGVPYVQVINDVTNATTGQADNPPSGIHFEPGLWMHVPATTVPKEAESLTRMASIPHGTTINAQSLTAPIVTPGPPTIPPVDITPFLIGNPGNKIPFPSQKAIPNQPAPARLPQDLTKFIATGTITQSTLDNPNSVLSNAIAGQKITQTTTFTVATDTQNGTSNIVFLQGGTSPAPNNQQQNANAVQMSATFWIEQVQHSIAIGPAKSGTKMTVAPPKPNPHAQVPNFALTLPHDIKQNTTITVTSTQIQYSQMVLLNFAGLTWPHVSCATLVPSAPVIVPATAFPA